MSLTASHPPRGRTARKLDRAYERRKERARADQASQSAIGRDIGRIPPVADPLRKAAACGSLRTFIETYLLKMFTVPGSGEHWPWAEYHLRTIAQVERSVRDGGMFAVALPRSGGKTSILKCGAMWAVMTGQRRWVCVIAATQEKAKGIVGAFKVILETNPLMAADFPEVCFPISALERIVHRQGGQTCLGRPTRMVWQADELVFADIPGCRAAPRPGGQPGRPLLRQLRPAAGGTITCTSLDSADMLGQVKAQPDGSQIRPDLSLFDDPQTEESARSPVQTAARLKTLRGAVEGMGPPGVPFAGLCAVTGIEQHDLTDQLLNDPAWNGVREPMLIREPVHRAATDAAVRHGDAWDRYAELMGEEQPAEAAAFYRSRWCGVHRPECVDRLDRDRDCPRCPAHDRCMDAGAVVSWRWRKNPEETSAVEHAMKIAIRNPVFFAAHMQQAPLSLESESVQVTAAMVARRVSGLPAGRVPMDCSHVSAYIDMHDEILYWAVCAWNPATFGGQVIDYGTFPEQPGRWFVQARPPRPMSSLFGRLGKAGAIAAGLEQLATRLMKTEFGRHAAGGQVTRFQVERLLVDARYPRHEPIIARVKRKMGSPVLMLAKGIGLTAEHKPFAAYSRKPGETLGHHWRIPNVRGTREFPFVAVDTNYWKSFVHRSLAIGAGEPGALTLFGAPSQFSEHEPFAEHLAASEYPTETMSRRWGNVVNVWKTRVGKPDNHWFDCVVGCAVGAAMLGCRSSEDARRAGAVGGSGGRRKALRPLGQIGR